MKLNFYELYNLLNENTVRQELKKFKQNRKFKEKNTIQSLLDEVKKVMFPPLVLVNISENSKNVISNWVLLKYLKHKEVNNNVLKWLDEARGKIENRNAEHFIAMLKHSVANILSRNPEFTGIRTTYDYIAANLDQQGNLNATLASKFNNPLFNVEDLIELDIQYHENLKLNKERIPGAKGKTIIEFEDGYRWVDLERGYCKKEGDAGRHCGNVNTKPGDTILSLRDRKNFVHLTFILNNGILEERKAFANNKPSEKFHPYIIELLKLPIIKGLGPGRYLPGYDFQLTDLKQEEAQKLISEKPEFKKNYYEQMLMLGKEILDPDEDIILELIYDYPRVFASKIKDSNILLKVFERVMDVFDSYKSQLLGGKSISNNPFPERSIEILVSLAKNNKAPEELLSKLFEFSKKIPSTAGVSLKDNLIKNANTPSDVLHELAIYFVAIWKAENSKIPYEVKTNPGVLNKSLLELLPSGRAIISIIDHPNVSNKTLDYFSELNDKIINNRLSS